MQQFCFATALSYISEIKRLCDSRKIGLTIVLIPDELQVSKPLQAEVIAASGLAGASYDFALPNRLLHAKFDELKIDYIDLITEFSAKSLDKRLYRPNNSHWNIAGNELAARLILQHLSAKLESGGPANPSIVSFPRLPWTESLPAAAFDSVVVLSALVCSHYQIRRRLHESRCHLDQTRPC